MQKTLIIIMFIFAIFSSIGVSLKIQQNDYESNSLVDENNKKMSEEVEYDDSNEEDKIEAIESIDKEVDIIAEENVEDIVDKKEDSNSSAKDNKKKKEETAWEKLGISEYDYYNSPEISWKTIDFSIKEYGSFEKTKETCYNAGTSYTEIESYRFRCYESYSYSGDFLGYHIEYFELES